MTESDRDIVLRSVEARLRGRRLIWVGPRGEDAQPLLQIGQLAGVFSAIAPLRALSVSAEYCLETVTGTRVDLDTYSMDGDQSEAAIELRRRLLTAMGEPAVAVPYRPLALISAAYFPRSDRAEVLGLFHERQNAFEHKPWVETELARRGVKPVPWRYFGDEDLAPLVEWLDAAGALVLRATRSDGGAGLRLVATAEWIQRRGSDCPASLVAAAHVVEQAADVSAALPQHLDGFIGASPLLWPNVPLNVNAVVYRNGSVTLHAPSVQLIGVPEYTRRPFGYCGNDFGAVASLDDRVLDDLERITRAAGTWLAREGYVGAFGIDAMVVDGEVLLTEINPRFQGSSAVGTELDRAIGRADMYLRHMDAMWAGDARDSVPLREIARAQPRLRQVIVHHIGAHPRRLDELGVRVDRCARLVPATQTRIAQDAIVMRVVQRSDGEVGAMVAGKLSDPRVFV